MLTVGIKIGRTEGGPMPVQFTVNQRHPGQFSVEVAAIQGEPDKTGGHSLVSIRGVDRESLTALRDRITEVLAQQ